MDWWDICRVKRRGGQQKHTSNQLKQATHSKFMDSQTTKTTKKQLKNGLTQARHSEMEWDLIVCDKL